MGKFIPISRQRISSVLPKHADSGGGFTIMLRGAPGEVVTMGAADIQGGADPVYASATVGSDGKATLDLGASDHAR